MALLMGAAIIPAGELLVSAQETAPASATSASDDPQRALAEHLHAGKTLLREGDVAAARTHFRAALEIDATHPEALRLLNKAQQQLELAKAKAAQHEARLREQAQELAITVARDKAAQRARQQQQADAQLAQARESQLKILFRKGQDLYRDGHYASAIDVLERLVLIDPSHPLVRDAQRLIAQAEGKQAAMRSRAAARLDPRSVDAPVAALEAQLTAKKIEIDTTLKYAKAALKDQRPDQAITLTQRALADDPEHHAAQRLLHEAQLAKLDGEAEALARRVEADERAMANDVLRAQLVPPARQVHLAVPELTRPPASGSLAARLRQPISLDFTDVPLADVLEFVSDAANVSILPSPALDLATRRVSLKVTDLPLEQTLRYLAKNQEMAYRIEEDAILLATPEEFSNELLDTRVFFLRNGLGPFALETAAVTPNPAITMQPVRELIERSVPQPPDAKLVIDERSGALIVTNTAENLQLVERLLSQLDVTPLQVLIEARFLELTDTDLEHLGLEAVLNSSLQLSKKGHGDGTEGSGHAIASGGGIKFPALTRESEALNVTLQGVLTGTQFEMVLHALEETQRAKTLSAPRVTALNNQTATIRVVDQFNYPTRYEVSLIQFDINGDGDFDDAGETEFANVPQDLQQRDIGILLNVTPSVGKDLRTITLVLAPEVSQFSQFRDLGGGVTVPEFTSSQLTTSVVLQDGGTAVLGGLMKDTTSETVTKVPFFGDLPVVGGLFRQREAADTRKNLLIFITARLLAPRGDTT